MCQKLKSEVWYAIFEFLTSSSVAQTAQSTFQNERKIQHSFPQQLCCIHVCQLTQERSYVCARVESTPPGIYTVCVWIALLARATLQQRSKDIWVTPKKRRERWWSENRIKAAENADAGVRRSVLESDLIWLEKVPRHSESEHPTCYFRQPLSPYSQPDANSKSAYIYCLCVMQIRRLGLRVQQWLIAASNRW